MKSLVINFLAVAGLILCAGCSSLAPSSETSTRPWESLATPEVPAIAPNNSTNSDVVDVWNAFVSLFY
jgi:hypothetical protein